MDNTINSDLIRGNIDTIILRALYGGDRYGYDIINEIEQRSSGKYKLKQPTLYSCLNRLENQGFIRSYWGTKSIGGRRKYYTLTEMGKELFIKNKTNWEYSKSLIDDLITDDEGSTAEQLDDSGETGAILANDTNKLEFDAILGENELNSAEEEDEDEEELAYSADEDEEEEELVYSDEEEDEEELAHFADEEDEGEELAYFDEDNIADEVAATTDFAASQNETATTDYSVPQNETTDAVDLSMLEIEDDEYIDELKQIMAESTANNYIKKIETEQYTPDKNIFTDEHLRTDNYFKDIEYGEDEEVQEDDSSDEQLIMPTIEDNQFSDGAASQWQAEKERQSSFSSQSHFRNAQQEGTVFHDAENVPKRKPMDSFISYNSPKSGKSGSVDTASGYSSDILKLFEEKLSGTSRELQEEKNSESEQKKDIYKLFEDKLSGIKKEPPREPEPKKDIHKIFEDKLSGIKKEPPREPEPKKDIHKIFEDKFADIRKEQPKERAPEAKKDIHKIFEDKIADARRAKEGEQSAARRAKEGGQPAKNSDATINSVPQTAQIVAKDSPEFFKKEQIQIRNFKRLQESTANLGDEIEIRSYEDDSARKFNEKYYYYSNKLKLRQYFILYLIILAEVIGGYLAINLGLRNTLLVSNIDLNIYIACVVLGMVFPTAAFLLNWNNPNKRKRVSQGFKIQMLFSILITVYLLMMIYFGNILLKMPYEMGDQYYTRVILPSIMCLNIPINTAIFNRLINSKRYSV